MIDVVERLVSKAVIKEAVLVEVTFTTAKPPKICKCICMLLIES